MWRALQVFSEWRAAGRHHNPPGCLLMEPWRPFSYVRRLVRQTSAHWPQQQSTKVCWAFCPPPPPRALVEWLWLWPDRQSDSGCCSSCGTTMTLVSVGSCEVWLLPVITSGSSCLSTGTFRSISFFSRPHSWRIIYHQLYQKERMRWDGGSGKRARTTVDMALHRPWCDAPFYLTQPATRHGQGLTSGQRGAGVTERSLHIYLRMCQSGVPHI